ncbi:uncharacterized protein LOC126758623 [Bactrocera neohumeralis]|uniref:uncharacterized protein LOC126758623 n=1 Tax=Bactrocera neohumeralis TaxID=98809 RepID=UPI0021665B3F|nr:uncharacterized protein LOC126758623 [Bactrocera neohumeralis]XP_050328928.1 uncharacterized protein LOC126758623 [Bactrocera neohumeralis]
MAMRKRRSGWTLQDETELLEKWEERFHDLRKAKRNAHIYQEIAMEMGGRYTAEEVHCKVKNLTKKYREEKSKIDPFGGSPSVWKHYQAIHRIMGSTAVNSALYVKTGSLMSIRKQRSEWTLPDEIELLEKWEERAHDLRKAKRNAHIYQEISVEMGRRYTAEEVHCKVKNLTKKYREEKSKIDPSGGSPSEWKHYQAVHRIIGSTAVNSALYVKTDSLNSPSPTSSMPSLSSPLPSPQLPSPSFQLSSPSPSSSSAPMQSPTARKRNYDGEMVKLIKQQTQILKTIAEESKLVNQEMVGAILEQNRITEKLLILMEKITEKLV